MFIVIEGPDGVGKSTQAQLLANALRKEHRVHLFREPGSTEVGESIRNILIEHRDIQDMTKILLFFAARVELLYTRICEALLRNEIVICDRYFYSTLVYQKNHNITWALVKNALLDLEPDLLIVLDADIQCLISRLRNKRDDWVSSEEEVFGLKGVIETYREIEDYIGIDVDLEVINAERSEMEIHKNILNVVKDKLEINWSKLRAISHFPENLQ